MQGVGLKVDRIGVARRLVENIILQTNNNNIIVSHHILFCLLFCDILFDIFGSWDDFPVVVV